MSSDSLPKGITTQAALWSSYVARNVKVQDAYNPDAIFITGRTLLDKETFNRLNTADDDVVHGVQVFYGPFSSKASAQEFVAEYKMEWPGDNEWRYIRPGQAEILSSYYDPGMADVVHNASLDFQGQLAVQEMQRRVQEIEEVQRRLSLRENADKTLSPAEKEQHVLWQQQRIKATEIQLEQLKKHLSHIESLPVTDACNM